MELLSPAGSPQAFRAAVICGADAVYVGVSSFNARAGAKNFTPEELKEAVEFAHKYGVKVHIALNTLVSDIETKDFLRTARMCCEYGADAFIVQDLGMFSLIKEAAPGIPVHASTQMSVHSLDGVIAAARLGASRVILARELDRDNIAYIVKNSPVEIEVFAHGAMCMSYSGQCLFSAMIAKRSGNRGRCGQPCRLEYTRSDGTRGHIMSLKDMCLAGYIDELKNMGVSSLKIEGRLKRPEYVAIVTSIYRRIIDEGGMPSSDEMRALDVAFSRDGFTDGYYTNKKGAQMFGMHEDNSKSEEYKSLLKYAKTLYEKEPKPYKKPVDMFFYAKIGEKSRLIVKSEHGKQIEVKGAVPEVAVTRPLTLDAVISQLKKTGATGYATNEVKAEIAEGISMKISVINEMRREALEKLHELEKPKKPEFIMPDLILKSKKRNNAYKMSIGIDDVDSIPDNIIDAHVDFLYIPLECVKSKYLKISGLVKSGQNVALKLPRVYFDVERPEIISMLNDAKRLGISTLLCTNIGQIFFVREMGFDVRCDFSLNVYNSYTLYVLEKMGVKGATLSYELMLSKIRDMNKPIDTEILIYGRQELMITENCLNGGIKGEDCEKCFGKKVILKDRRGERFLIRREFGCRSCVLNGHVLYLLDKLDDIEGLGISHIRLNFTDESKEDISEIFSRITSKSPKKPKDFTRGLYYKGVM